MKLTKLRALTVILIFMFSAIAVAVYKPTKSPETSGTVAWIEFRVSDLHRAEIFYKRLFNWELQPVGPDYLLIVNKGVEIGGIERTDATRLPYLGSRIYIYVEDLKLSYALALASGATTEIKPKEIPDSGSFAVVRDPDGNSIGLYSTKPLPKELQ